MASTTTEKDDEKAMATDVIAPDRDEGGGGGGEERHQPPPPRTDEAAGFFHIYKSGQGYWTRMGTVLGALLIAALTANFLYQHMPIWFQGAGATPQRAKTIAIVVIAALLVASARAVFWVMNNPTNAAFLTPTDGEMKKVTGPSRKELMGSTKVV